jgi:hypothetical protein
MQTGKQAGNIKETKKPNTRPRHVHMWTPFGSKKQKKYILEKTGPVKLIHTLLFIIENIQGSRQREDFITFHLRFFISHKSGLHLLLLLLNVHYNKVPAGRMPGWSFGLLRDKSQVLN